MKTSKLSRLTLLLIQCFPNLNYRVEATVRGSDSANSSRVLHVANSDGGGEGSGGVLDDGLTEE